MNKIKIMVLVFTLFPHVCNAGDTRFGLGVGAQYGGIVGMQLYQEVDNGISRVAAGILGVSIGHDRYISSNISLGAQLFYLTVAKGAGLNLNYHIGSREKESLVIGVEVSSVKLMDGFMGVSAENEALVHISAGFKF